ncbi:nucleotide sugar dehydrogenase (plasmid) [Haloferax mediterranei ATCC 33500]|uniref:UDP-N-acetyl-D-mannosamine dehydrogenase n=1 Tax=Haloferax mediterranei (strain ATCC 33500 / DSM 1411 / JCM 8866 / NBRC 14739 / NCIMB 2177 / R-4) TaxID=523841 RepID=I3RAU3_HALMT|nr:nucleotide sugar dehydrogenase [Haloferax mediterranei]AFK21353.1 nucleotide sugar dehydrogenase / UDP-N-acetyl-D-mannosaminuronic acid dehydrogenase [Haloferax mediterranei ATCC 33500]AHZ24564.1 nucleotide sugar dehydrogenase [Haloferax mediterranei ATCC 33500]ELZ97320.1 nucleotide sugar dehydrogenase / UDP-N-acetyl-D-mannosaminuronic acid dehydrogenase [Haloferax mediterranei ATCC 33500]MDX5990383.1 nucleotide sugar dehydrogenase [Haloferax mediterranei ATCC 33500]QCQ76957.1 nucleotide su
MSNQTTGLYNSTHPPEEQKRELRNGSHPVAVYGLGKMGLPLAAVYAEATSNVVGVDIDDDVVRSINDGECHVAKEPELPELVAEQVERGALRATTDSVAAAGAASVHVIIVPTPLTDDREPDLAAFEAVLDSIAESLAPGDTVIVECTVPPGTCSDLVGPYLEAKSGVSRDEFGVAFCPERTSSGRAVQDITASHPKIVGGVDAESTRVAALVYGEITSNEVIAVRDATTAEAVKLFEGIYRDVNIALANELARIRDDLGIDVTEAIEAANTQPYCNIHDPGPGVGGHCIPWYPYFITSRVESATPLLQTAREVNDSMPRFTADKLRDELAESDRDIADSTVAVLGITYRPGVAETRATPAAGVIDRLNEFGANVLAVDPMLDADGITSFGATPVSLSELPEQSIDAVVVVTPHEEFDDIDWGVFDDLVVIDGRGTLGDIDHRVYAIGAGPRGTERLQGKSRGGTLRAAELREGGRQ